MRGLLQDRRRRCHLHALMLRSAISPLSFEGRQWRPPRDDGKRRKRLSSRCDLHPSFCSRSKKRCLSRMIPKSGVRFSDQDHAPLKSEAFFNLPRKGRRSAERRTSVAAPGKQPQPRYASRSPFGAPPRLCAGIIHPNSAWAALPGIRRMQTGVPSPTPVQQAPCSPITRRTGRCPNRLQAKSDELRLQEPLPLRQSRHRLTSLTMSRMTDYIMFRDKKSILKRLLFGDVLCTHHE